MLRKLLFCLAILIVAGPAAADDAMLCSRETGDAAVAACTRAINSGEGRPSINYNSRGEAYSGKGDTDRFIADLTEWIRRNPKSAFPYNNRGLAYWRKGDTDRAIADFAEAIRVDPQNAFAYVNRGLAYEKLADFARARADYNTMLGLSKAGAKWLQEKARERLAALPSPSATSSFQKSNVATAIVTSTAPVLNNDRRIALVIGNSAYENAAALPNQSTTQI